MILSQVRSYLKAVEGAGLNELVRELNYDPAVVEQALETWIRKGKVILLTPEGGCSGCSCGSSTTSCSTLSDLVRIYRWVEKEGK